MANVIVVMSMSLDGYVTAGSPRPGEPLGTGGQRLVEWAFGDDARDREILQRGIGSIGAVVAGRRTYDTSVPWWRENGPTGPARVPVFVVSHSAPAEVPKDGVYTFVDGLDAAVDRAKSAAGGKDVSVMGGADVVQQSIRLKLVDQIQVHLVPVLFGAGTRLFDHIGGEHIDLEPTQLTQGGKAIHLRFRVVR
jgi:dihydrofolate reductase